jgi:universal stress protein A
MEPVRTIVAAVDFSETSCEVVQAALALARDGDGHVCLVHAVPHVIQTPWVVDASGLDIDDLQDQWVAEAETQLACFAATLRLDPRRVSAEVVVGPAAFEIVRYANQRGAEVLVLGSHQGGAIRRFLIGSVAGRVLREAGCPVMFVPDRARRGAVREVRTLRVAGAGDAA